MLLRGTIGYLLIVFPLAYVWHLVAFESTYRELGYFSREEPIVAFGFVSVVLQGVLLSFLYPLICRTSSVLANLFLFVLVMGGYHWTVHVLAEAAKHPIEPLSTWFALESAYLLIQFASTGLLFAVVHRSTTVASSS
ncbi:hypothetical protein [Rhodopirellula sp. MGV]|uniref:hypothetical protein n=1 Tax=Rhodopirellula sp. MGV TaxID=2023130 RepID=UPI000B95F46C|nr:hypothetical protein [Rhodopirellula sp. MGV]OYP30355.1 hypothetical protein CGZ80_23010 [Rhodopirellula sp. MGV]PNY34711.1 hypothetical protein C2E31_22360 [Rhodopirellula baltica]